MRKRSSMRLFALSLCFHLGAFVTAAPSCSCSSLVIPVPVDTLVPKDPTDAFGGRTSNASSLRRVNETYDIYGVFCRPDTVSSNTTDVLQLLVHGFSYTSQYWSPPAEEFRNYSYTAFSCDRGLSSLAIDLQGVGLSSRPLNASDVQYPTCAATLSQLARTLKNASILPGVPPFKKIIGIGHSAGSGFLNFGAIVEGAQSPFDGLILTGAINAPASAIPPLSLAPSARDDDPARWGTLDPAYITFSDPVRALFYPTDPTTFSPRMVTYDDDTKDVGTVSTYLQTPLAAQTTAQYTGPVAKVVGSEDQVLCAGTDRCVNVTALTAVEKVFWPAVQSLEVVVLQGSGHSMNLDFLANGAFDTFVKFVNQFAGL